MVRSESYFLTVVLQASCYLKSNNAMRIFCDSRRRISSGSGQGRFRAFFVQAAERAFTEAPLLLGAISAVIRAAFRGADKAAHIAVRKAVHAIVASV
jgi:hypothetical protein